MCCGSERDDRYVSDGGCGAGDLWDKDGWKPVSRVRVGMLIFVARESIILKAYLIVVSI